MQTSQKTLTIIAHARGISTKEITISLSMDSEVKVTINYNCAADDSKRDGLKGYFTNTDITTP